MTLTYIYADSTAVLGPLATFAEPHAYDLCEFHARKLTVPNGWSVIKEEISHSGSGPTDDDLMAIADAVRKAASVTPQVVGQTVESTHEAPHIGVRRGHLRAVPN
ncbi:MAG: DUF3499 domain-containing protein [Candidatus Planktophila sp.]